ncbi:hypothetical protein HFD88_000153 [Aspergillus terreus]|nr:hypothetical protein HFD88_000153 [Aspergillus terreus]
MRGDNTEEDAELRRPSHRADFEIALICALPVEFDAVEALFDEYYEGENFTYGKAPGDPNAYTTGRLHNHNVVLAYLPGMGKSNAASAAASFRASFNRIKLCIVVGICGGVPNPKGTDDEKQTLLGDVIISTGLIQFDFGRQYPTGFVRKDTLQDSLNRSNTAIRSYLAKLSGAMSHKRLKDKTAFYIAELCGKDGFQASLYPGADNDRLYEPTYRHKHQNSDSCPTCARCHDKDAKVCSAALVSSCEELGCQDSHLVTRTRVERARGIGPGGHPLSVEEAREAQKPSIHFGLIASGDLVMKSGRHRDEIASRENVIAFEMEGAGVWESFPTVIIKGVCDYADSHKSKVWQKYAAATAAACMKAFLLEWRPEDPVQVKRSWVP